MTGQLCPQQDKKQRESEPLQVQSRFRGRFSPRSHLDVTVGLDWGIARSPNCKHGDPPVAFFHRCIGKSSKEALATGISDIPEALKKRKLTCVVGEKDSLGSTDVHGLRKSHISIIL